VLPRRYATRRRATTAFVVEEEYEMRRNEQRRGGGGRHRRPGIFNYSYTTTRHPCDCTPTHHRRG
jgi:hypothetical protein